MKTTIGGIEFPLSFTVEAQKKVEEKFGGMDKSHIEQIFDTTDFKKYEENIAFMAATMINADIKREKVRAKIMFEEITKRAEVTPEDVLCLIRPGELTKTATDVIKAINEGNKINIEIVPEKGKNAETAQSE